MRTAVAEVPRPEERQVMPNQGAFLSRQELARWRHITNLGSAASYTTVDERSIWNEVATHYPVPDQRVINRRTPGVNLTDTDLAMLGPRQNDDPVPWSDAFLHRVINGLREA